MTFQVSTQYRSFVVDSINRNEMEKTEMSHKDQLTISAPEAGRRYFGLSRGASYEAAKRGDIPTIRIGRLIRVPVRAVERMLDKAAERSRGGAEAA